MNMANFVSPSGTPNPNMKIEKEIKKEISDQLSTEVHLPILILPTTNDEIETEMTKKINRAIYFYKNSKLFRDANSKVKNFSEV